MALRHCRCPGMTPSIIEAQGLGGLLEYIILLSYQFFSILAIVIRYDIANWSSWPIGSAIGMSFLRQEDRLVWHNFYETRQVIVVSSTESGLGSGGSGMGFQREFICLFKVLVVTRSIGILMGCPYGGYY